MQDRVQVKSITITALMTALVYLAGSIIKIPTFGGFVHAGDCMVLFAAARLGSKKGALAAGTGMLLVDVLGGYAVWAPFTFVIKGIMAYMAGVILEKFGTHGVKAQLAAFIPASIFMVAAYFLAGALIASFLAGDALGLAAGFAFSAKDIPGNILQVTTGILIAIPLCSLMNRINL